MLEIEYLGRNAIALVVKNGKLFIDPATGLIDKGSLKKIKYELLTESDFSASENEDVVSLDGPGEYEVGDFNIKGKSAKRHIDTEADVEASTIYRIETMGFNIGVVGNVDSVFGEDKLEFMGVLDILILPVGGGGYTLDGRDAAKIVKEVDPKVVIPIHYKESGVDYEVPQEGVDEFISQVGLQVNEVDKLKFKNVNELPPSMTVYKLKRS